MEASAVLECIHELVARSCLWAVSVFLIICSVRIH